MAEAGDQPLASCEPAPSAPFRAVLTPHRSLGRLGFVVVMSVLGGVSFAAGMAFWAIGAWPVLGFFGLDVALVYVAFRLNYRDGRAYEMVEVTRDVLRLTRVSAKGRSESVELNPYWARVRLTEGTDGRSSLAVTLHGREHVIGRFLTDEERRSLADALQAELGAVRG